MISPSPTVEIDLPAAVGEAFRSPKSYWAESWERLRANQVAILCAGLILLLVVLAAIGPATVQAFTHLDDPYRPDLRHTFGGPTGRHWLGTDELGRDVLVRMLYGARVSLGVGLLTVAISLVVGSAVGMAAGFYGGLLDLILMRFVDMVLSIPSIYLLILLAILHPLGLSPKNPLTLSVIIAITGWGGLARLVRGEVLSVKQRDFILATRSIGASNLRLMLRHLLPNFLAVLIVVASLAVGAVILTEAALDFIGLGIQPPTPSWGNMLNNAQSYFFHSVGLVMLPGVAIFITVLAMNLLGNAVRDAFDPRLK